jgi:type I restriction enzyme S subunit
MNRQQTTLGSCPDHWQVVTFETVANLKHGYQFRSHDFTSNGIKVFKITQIKGDGTIDIDNCSFIEAKRSQEFQKFFIGYGDILMALSGATIGKLSRFKSTERVLQNYRVGNFLPLDELVLNKDYFYYFLTSKITSHQILANQTQSAQENVGKEDIHKMKVFLPPLPEQKAIAEVLSSIDDKIDLLHRNNKTLEEMAETLFRQWFVEGIPSNTPETNIYDYVKIEYGFPFSSKKFNEKSEGTQLIRIRDITKGFSNTYTTELANEIYIINQGDLLVGMDGEFRIHIWGGSKAWLNQRVCRVKPLDGTPPLWAYFMMKPHLNFYEQTKGGTTVIHIGKSDFDEIRIPIPQRATLDKYNRIVQPLFMKILSNYSAITHCTALRNTLLPKLMSGQVRVNI